HETRERPGDYGPTTEADVTDTGTMTLTDEEWAEFLGFLQDGTVSARNDSADAGGDGPWTFLYWKNDKAKYQVFSFRDDGTRLQFEAFCAALAQTAR
ncbi:MAG: hypothetical protein IJQ17_01145, partial [Oscillospiraceae bacterium]|nr:hypothetical protein [Oscillospiraceae bacterium]